MQNPKAVKAAFEDELQKIAGEMQGFTRIGRKPIGIERLLEREIETTETPSDLFAAGAEKVSAVRKLAGDLAKYKVPAALLGGAAGYHVLQTAEKDRRLGRQVRKQQNY
jgi:hypothetical protein